MPTRAGTSASRERVPRRRPGPRQTVTHQLQSRTAVISSGHPKIKRPYRESGRPVAPGRTGPVCQGRFVAQLRQWPFCKQLFVPTLTCFLTGEIDALARAICQAKAAVLTPVQTVIAGHSDADELSKLADLRDRGILTDAEFQAKKAQILGLR
jgi:hypothetical protein